MQKRAGWLIRELKVSIKNWRETDQNHKSTRNELMISKIFSGSFIFNDQVFFFVLFFLSLLNLFGIAFELNLGFTFPNMNNCQS